MARLPRAALCFLRSGRALNLSAPTGDLSPMQSHAQVSEILQTRIRLHFPIEIPRSSVPAAQAACLPSGAGSSALIESARVGQRGSCRAGHSAPPFCGEGLRDRRGRQWPQQTLHRDTSSHRECTSRYRDTTALYSDATATFSDIVSQRVVPHSLLPVSSPKSQSPVHTVTAAPCLSLWQPSQGFLTMSQRQLQTVAKSPFPSLCQPFHNLTASQKQLHTATKGPPLSLFQPSQGPLTASQRQLHTGIRNTELLEPAHTDTRLHTMLPAGPSLSLHRPAWHRKLHTVSRNPAFSELTHADMDYFRGVVGGAGVVEEEQQLAVANADWMGKFKGSSKLLLQPKTTEQVSQILAHCNKRRLAVVPQGGNTGLVGGSVPVFDEVIVNLGKMNNIISFDEVSGILVCEAGCVLETLDTFVANKGFCMPLDLGAKGSCQIGGNLSTNAGGLRLLRYGSLRGTVLGVEAVLADGSVLNLLKQLRKDNTGYDLKQLFIGSEGTLGIVTKVAILTPPRSPSVHVAFLACPSYEAVLETFKASRRHLSEILSAFELMDRASLEMVTQHLQGTRDPLPDSRAPFYVLVETSGSSLTHDKEKLDTLLERVMEEGAVVDGTVAQDSGQAASLWRLREGIAEALQKAGAVYKYDLSIPVQELYALVREMRHRLEGTGATAVGYGHVGDGNLHLNVSAKEYSEQLLGLIEPFVYEWTSERRGSVSAEHGLGFMKAHAMHYSQTQNAMEHMMHVKKLLDPNGILNPYKVLTDVASSL